ncbi:hypothetical protein BT63DRAFT_424099 [Microthyrium microscopicum]|uniref:Uncharacterized protein n=1 Tax=Microthyrium microscopicum TaxID=703497 RepID=A0A6A6UET5_9PEZI|nr:hypothetical protein BT63DRAFT_424099 [Microthyrium microscopicum]
MLNIRAIRFLHTASSATRRCYSSLACATYNAPLPFDPDHALKHIPPIPIATSATSSTNTTALILLSKSYASQLNSSSKFLPSLVTKLFGNNVSPSSLSLGVAVVDFVPHAANGISYLVGYHSKSVLSASSAATKNSQLISHVSVRLRSDSLLSSIKLPVTNTLFENGHISTQIVSDWTIGPDGSRCVSNRHVDNLSLDLSVLPGASTVRPSIRIPRSNLSSLRRIEESLGNVIRTLSVPGGNTTIPASLEITQMISESSNRLGSGSHIYAMVIPPELYESIISLHDNSPKKGSSDSLDLHDYALAADVDLAPYLQNGMTIHRVVGGGGEWGHRASLLTLDPSDPFQTKPSLDNVEDLIASLQEKSIAPIGHYIQFYVSQPSIVDTSVCTTTLSTDDCSICFGQQTEASIPASGQSSKTIYPNIFGGLSTAGFALEARSTLENHGMEVPQASFLTYVDSPGSRFQATLGSNFSRRSMGGRSTHQTQRRMLHTNQAKPLDSSMSPLKFNHNKYLDLPRFTRAESSPGVGSNRPPTLQHKNQPLEDNHIRDSKTRSDLSHSHLFDPRSIHARPTVTDSLATESNAPPPFRLIRRVRRPERPESPGLGQVSETTLNPIGVSKVVLGEEIDPSEQQLRSIDEGTQLKKIIQASTVSSDPTSSHFISGPSIVGDPLNYKSHPATRSEHHFDTQSQVLSPVLLNPEDRQLIGAQPFDLVEAVPVVPKEPRALEGRGRERIPLRSKDFSSALVVSPELTTDSQPWEEQLILEQSQPGPALAVPQDLQMRQSSKEIRKQLVDSHYVTPLDLIQKDLSRSATVVPRDPQTHSRKRQRLSRSGVAYELHLRPKFADHTMEPKDLRTVHSPAVDSHAVNAEKLVSRIRSRRHDRTALVDAAKLSTRKRIGSRASRPSSRSDMSISSKDHSGMIDPVPVGADKLMIRWERIPDRHLMRIKRHNFSLSESFLNKGLEGIVRRQSYVDARKLAIRFTQPAKVRRRKSTTPVPIGTTSGRIRNPRIKLRAMAIQLISRSRTDPKAFRTDIRNHPWVVSSIYNQLHGSEPAQRQSAIDAKHAKLDLLLLSLKKDWAPANVLALAERYRSERAKTRRARRLHPANKTSDPIDNLSRLSEGDDS